MRRSGVYVQVVEHGGAVHSYSPHSGNMLGCVEEVGISDIDEVVGSGGPGIPREAVGGVGGWI